MSNAGVPYSRAFRQSDVVAGQANAIMIPAPIRGTLTRLVIKEVGGTDNFTATLYTSELPAGQQEQFSDVDSDDDLSAELFKLMAAISGSSGIYENYDLSKPYVVNEKSHKHGKLKSALYLKLTPSGSGTKVYDIAITVLTPVFS